MGPRRVPKAATAVGCTSSANGLTITEGASWNAITVHSLDLTTRFDKPMDAKMIEAEIAKLIAETSRINAESRWYRFGLGAALASAAAAFTKVLL